MLTTIDENKNKINDNLTRIKIPRFVCIMILMCVLNNGNGKRERRNNENNEFSPAPFP